MTLFRAASATTSAAPRSALAAAVRIAAEAAGSSGKASESAYSIRPPVNSMRNSPVVVTCASALPQPISVSQRSAHGASLIVTVRLPPAPILRQRRPATVRSPGSRQASHSATGPSDWCRRTKSRTPKAPGPLTTTRSRGGARPNCATPTRATSASVRTRSGPEFRSSLSAPSRRASKPAAAAPCVARQPACVRTKCQWPREAIHRPPARPRPKSSSAPSARKAQALDHRVRR